MKRRTLCLLLACFLPIALLTACEPKESREMTAVTIGTAEPTETEETTEATEATEDKRTAPAPAPVTPASTEAPTNAPTEAQTDVPASSEEIPVTEQTQATEQPSESLRSLALLCVGSEVSALYGLIGYPPNGSVYTPTDRGEDGVLYYDGFAVYTHRESGMEYIWDVR